ncbi:hypothetical protein GmHk_16G046625 [Glycine max]|nr:hypothetical protein GmHk_16G046625 [Glycine max]
MNIRKNFFRMKEILLMEEVLPIRVHHDLQIMVRTRGLGHVLSRVIGRGLVREDEHHADDVPRRRRPTASARRRRVDVAIAEDVPQVTEDVPRVIEDVPHMDKDIPERTAEVDDADIESITIDGAEGSPGDHAEGFPGRPRDPSILTSFAYHVAHSIWSGQERPELKLISHGRKVDKFGRLAPEIKGVLHSFEPLLVDEAVFLLMELLQCWIYEYFPSVHQCVIDDAYADTTPRASRWLTMKAQMRGITEAPYQARSAEMRFYCGLCSTREGGPTVQAGDQPRHPPAPHDEEYVEPHIPKVPMASDLPRHSVDACEGCEAIAERLERVLNLRMVTEGTELHEIMQDCLRIAGGDA